MARNSFEDSRVSAGTLSRGGQKPGGGAPPVEESRSVSRDDIRDGAAHVLSARTLTGNRVRNEAGEDLGEVEEIMLDVPGGRIAYAVLSFGGIGGFGNKLFAVPWSVLRLDVGKHEFILDASREMLENSPGFDKGNWPHIADAAFQGAATHDERGVI
jgi:sporulation protein YlmC with PRC-barrel domain